MPLLLAPAPAPRRPAPRRFDLTLSTLALFLAGGLLLVLGAMVTIGTSLVISMEEVVERWRDYDLGAATKTDALSELRGVMGFGGVIDQFHEFRITGNSATRKVMEANISKARANLDVYRFASATTREEDQAIDCINDALNTIQSRLPQVEDAFSRGIPPLTVMQETAVDVQPAVRSMRILNSQLSLERSRLTSANLDAIAHMERLLIFSCWIAGFLLLTIAGSAVWVTRDRVIRPLRRLVEESTMLARQELETPFVWSGHDELSHLGASLENSRTALRAAFSEIEEKARKLALSERRYAMAAAAANDGLWDWDLTTGEVYISARFHQMIGLTDCTLEGRFERLLDQIHDEDRGRVAEGTQKLITETDHDTCDIEFRILHADGNERWLLLRGMVAREADGRAVRMAGSAADITERKGYEARLVYQATHDHLTGLRNRAFLVGWLRERFAVAEAEGATRSSLALLFLDIDGFKVINDSLGHAIGDQLLIAVGNRIGEALDESQFVIRLGGDEFVVVLNGGGEPAAVALAHRLENDLNEPFAIQGLSLTTSASIGVAIDDGLSPDPDSLLRDADIALYRAKEHGKARTEVFNAALREAILIRHRLQTDLARAIAAEDIFLVYQPIVTLDDGRLTGFEALVRWRHPELGLISPVQFIPIAEETGQILPLGRYVLETAVASLARWRNRPGGAPPLTVNVNLSPRQMWDEAYIEEMLRWLADGRTEGLKIEVTESMTMSNPERAQNILSRFRDIGVPLCIDDFGTGYSSLSYLNRFPFNVLKVDKSFVSGITTTPGQSRLVRGIINLAHDLGLSVVGEGVETAEERQALMELGCDHGQGYLFARPLPAADVEALLDKCSIGPEGETVLYLPV